MIDIIGGFFVGTILLLIAMTAMDNGVRQFVNHNADAIVQNELATTSEIIQNDLRKVGFGIPEAQQATIIQTAQPTHFEYLSNLNPTTDLVPDTIEYSISAFDTVSFIDTSIVLYAIYRRVHIVGAASKTGQVGTIANNQVFRYLDQVGRPVTYIPATKMVEVTMVALNPNIYVSDEVLQASGPQERMIELRKLLRESYWRQTRVISKNLRR